MRKQDDIPTWQQAVVAADNETPFLSTFLELAEQYYERMGGVVIDESIYGARVFQNRCLEDLPRRDGTGDFKPAVGTRDGTFARRDQVKYLLMRKAMYEEAYGAADEHIYAAVHVTVIERVWSRDKPNHEKAPQFGGKPPEPEDPEKLKAIREWPMRIPGGLHTMPLSAAAPRRLTVGERMVRDPLPDLEAERQRIIARNAERESVASTLADMPPEERDLHISMMAQAVPREMEARRRDLAQYGLNPDGTPLDDPENPDSAPSSPDQARTIDPRKHEESAPAATEAEPPVPIEAKPAVRVIEPTIVSFDEPSSESHPAGVPITRLQKYALLLTHYRGLTEYGFSAEAIKEIAGLGAVTDGSEASLDQVIAGVMDRYNIQRRPSG